MLFQSKAVQYLHGIGRHLNACANPREFIGLLKDIHRRAKSAKRCGGGKAANAGTNYGNAQITYHFLSVVAVHWLVEYSMAVCLELIHFAGTLVGAIATFFVLLVIVLLVFHIRSCLINSHSIWLQRNLIYGC